MSTSHEFDPDFGPIRKAAPERGIPLWKCLAWIAVVGFALGLLMPAISTRDGCGRRPQCQNNLRNIGLALLQYEQRHGAFPPVYTTDRDGRPLHSWRTLILPYLDEIELYNSIDFSKPWDDPANAKALGTDVLIYHCPSLSPPRNSTTYLANAAEGGLLMPGKPRRLGEVEDGKANTLMVIEVDDPHAVPWMAPIDADESLILGLLPDSKLAHPGGMNAAFVDGAIRFLKASLPASTRRALISIAGKEALSIDEY